MKIYEHKVIGQGRNKTVVNILFHKSYKNKKSFYHYFWLKNINNIKKQLKDVLFVLYAMRNSVLVRH